MNSEATWVRITACENIPVREGRVTVVHGRQIAIFHLGERFLAVENRCPHRGGPLAEGIVSGTTVVCPLHAWKIDLETGGVVSSVGSAAFDACVKTFATRVVDGVLELEVSAYVENEEPVAENCAHHDRPIRWVQRKLSAPASAGAEVS